ncbi:ECF transporter S component [Thermohalobacter berrensis]|uniref:ECF transporter S component n=1 Tax=Thermohalobacter berrensis TaxID=99594 RepID=A0A419SZA3_9FIRM|nr:ECF transporter S component [Thermohalobacter berrensis]RKD30592.1 ECF transporter S component [Thermohalobacter berrensis]
MRESSIIKRSKVTKLTYCALLIALSAIGSMIKIQGSIAFDSMPGFFAALFLGPVYGAVVAGIGHFLTATLSGFWLTIPMHIIVALEMALFGYIFGIVYKKINGIIASMIAIILNGPVAALIAVPTSLILGLPLRGWSLFYAVIIPLTVASAANVVLAFMLYKVLQKRIG